MLALAAREDQEADDVTGSPEVSTHSQDQAEGRKKLAQAKGALFAPAGLGKDIINLI